MKTTFVAESFPETVLLVEGVVFVGFVADNVVGFMDIFVDLLGTSDVVVSLTEVLFVVEFVADGFLSFNVEVGIDSGGG